MSRCDKKVKIEAEAEAEAAVDVAFFKALKSLSKPQRQVMILRIFLNSSFSEIGTSLGITESRAQEVFRLACEKLKENRELVVILQKPQNK